VPGARIRAENGELAFGTVDTYLIWRLTGGRVHATDATNASRTMLFNIHDQDWDDYLLKLFNVPGSLPPEVRDSADDYGSTDAQPEVMGRVFGIVYRCIATHLIRKAGFTRKTAQTGADILIQRFGSALNLNVHFHMLFLDGVYIERTDGRLRFRWVKAPTSAELNQLTQILARRIGRYLERQGLLECDPENSHLTHLVGDGFEAGAMGQVLGSSITYRIAIGPQRGRKVFTACSAEPSIHWYPGCTPWCGMGRECLVPE
jgi:hypothetical protein